MRTLKKQLLAVTLLLLPLSVLAEADSGKFIRLREADGQPQAMETAVVRYVPADEKNPGLVVDLVGAVHVADKAYYQKLNKLFESYDVVLYELVAPKGTRPKPGRRGGSLVTSVQVGMKNLMDLTFQMDEVDYSKKNLVHADMSPEEFSRSMKKRGESFMKMFFKIMSESMAQQASGKNQVSDFDILVALFAKDRALRLKRIMAQQFQDMDVLTKVMDGPKGSTLLTERNKKALSELKRQIAAGKKRIAIFYGAAHLPHMERKLLADFGLKRDETRWVEAWKLTK